MSGHLSTDREWKQWGEVDPLYGVATVMGKSKTGPKPWTPSEFYAIGEVDWRVFRTYWQRYGINGEVCLEVGCGAGRLTKWLAKDFEHVHAIDVSPGMIGAATVGVPDANVSFHVTQGTIIPLQAGSVTAAFSVHMFQHLPNLAAGKAYFREIARVLKPGSTVMIHLPLLIWPTGVSARLHAALHKANMCLTYLVANIREAAFILGIRKQPPMRGVWYDARWVREALQDAGFMRIEFSLLFHDTPMGNGYHPFVFATKGKQ